jgi:hypothetical protein
MQITFKLKANLIKTKKTRNKPYFPSFTRTSIKIIEQETEAPTV